MDYEGRAGHSGTGVEAGVAISYVGRLVAVTQGSALPVPSPVSQVVIMSLPVVALGAAAAAGAISSGALIVLLGTYAAVGRGLSGHLRRWRLARAFAGYPLLADLHDSVPGAAARAKGRIVAEPNSPPGDEPHPVVDVRAVHADGDRPGLSCQTRATDFWLELPSTERVVIVVEGACLVQSNGPIPLLPDLSPAHRRRATAEFHYQLRPGDEVEVLGTVDHLDHASKGAGAANGIVRLRSAPARPLMILARFS